MAVGPLRRASIRGGLAPTATKRKLGPARFCWGKGVRGAFFVFGHRSLVTWPGCHFVARPPFRAAEWGQGSGGGAAVANRGRGWRQRPGCPPPETQASASLLFFASGLDAWGSSCTVARPRGAGCAGRVKPPKSRREACTEPTIFPAH